MQSKPILILGMHRSGTSAMSRFLNILGVDLGPNLVAPRFDNTKGFWEHHEIRDLDIKLREAIGSIWHDVRALPDHWDALQLVQEYRVALRSIILRDFGESGLWGLKDPHMCRLLPLWRLVFADLELVPHCVVIFRNPLEVAASLKERDDLNQNHAMMFWLRHSLDIEAQTRPYPRVFIHFDDMLSDWRRTATRISSAFSLEWPRSYGDAAPLMVDFLETGLRHHSLPDLDGAPKPVRTVYQAFLQAMESPYGTVTELCASVAAPPQEEVEAFVRASLEEEIQRLLQERGWAHAERDTLASERDALAADLWQTRRVIAIVTASRSWRWTAPVRSLFNKFFPPSRTMELPGATAGSQSAESVVKEK